MNAANTMILSEAGTGFYPEMPPVSLPDFTLRPGTLDQAIQKAADGLKDTLRPMPGNPPQPFAQARAALALLARCYAKQIYSSTSVARRAANDPDFHWFCLESVPEAKAIRRFRAENRDAIHHCLTVALQFQVEEKVSAGRLTRVNVRQLAEEACRRIIMAAYADCMELGAIE
jgi:hypothetical protein